MSFPPPPEHLSLLPCTEQSCFLNVLSRDCFMKKLIVRNIIHRFSICWKPISIVTDMNNGYNKTFNVSKLLDQVLQLIMLSISPNCTFKRKQLTFSYWTPAAASFWQARLTMYQPSREKAKAGSVILSQESHPDLYLHTIHGVSFNFKYGKMFHVLEMLTKPTYKICSTNLFCTLNLVGVTRWPW